MEVSYLIDKRTDIFNSAREVFYLKGFKDTNVSDITKMAETGVGTFYNYYSSKEKLFFEIYFKENEKIKMQIMKSINLNDDPVVAMKTIVAQNISAINTNLILKEWYNSDISDELEQYYNEEKNKNLDFYNFLTELFKKWKAEGKIRNDIDNEIVLSLFELLVYIDTHKGEIGIQHFPQIMQYLVEFIMKGLIDCGK
jgi:AcrR family transcriptional regulator